jgi:cysteine desulfurase
MTISSMRIYLDHNAGSPIRPAAADAIASVLGSDSIGNPASVHQAGQAARRALELARNQVGSTIAAPARTIVFTSGGTESNNLAIFGAVRSAGGRRRIVSSAIEHSSILAPLGQLEREGFEIVRAYADHEGLLDSAAVVRQIDHDTALVTIGLVNAEIGVIQDVRKIADASRRVGAMFHLDAAQAAGRIPLAVGQLGCDLLTLSGHKIGGPPGIGALYIRPEVKIVPLMLGGPQEAARRAGTPNLMGAIGFGAAAEAAIASFDQERHRISSLAGQLLQRLERAIPGLALNGPREYRVPNTLNLTFPEALGETLLIALDLEGVEVSMGSACAAGAVEPSHVLLAMGRSASAARSSLRISLGWSTTLEEITAACDLIPRVWQRVAGATSNLEGQT